MKIIGRAQTQMENQLEIRKHEAEHNRWRRPLNQNSVRDTS